MEPPRLLRNWPPFWTVMVPLLVRVLPLATESVLPLGMVSVWSEGKAQLDWRVTLPY